MPRVVKGPYNSGPINRGCLKQWHIFKKYLHM
jgi:hypothetical protein